MTIMKSGLVKWCGPVSSWRVEKVKTVTKDHSLEELSWEGKMTNVSVAEGG